MASEGLFETTTIPGHLAPTAERLERLLAKQSLDELYEVEEQPFARGKYATVRRCRERSTGRQWAAKFLKKRRTRAQELKAEALHEVAVLDAAKHCTRLVSLHQVFETPTEMVLVLELAPGGELQMVLDRDEIPEEQQVAKLLRQILDGVAFLHSLNVAHLDIKPQNLVLTGEFPDCDVKLCDLGISRYISPGADIREILGTPDYTAPEVLNYEPISLATDMWSVGVLMYVLLTGCSPFGGDTKQETFCNISRCNLDFPDDLFEEVSEEAQDLIRRLIVKNPSERLTASECLQHVWFTKFEEDLPLSLSPCISESSEVLEGEMSSCDSNSSTCSSASSLPLEQPPTNYQDENDDDQTTIEESTIESCIEISKIEDLEKEKDNVEDKKVSMPVEDTRKEEVIDESFVEEVSPVNEVEEVKEKATVKVHEISIDQRNNDSEIDSPHNTSYEEASTVQLDDSSSCSIGSENDYLRRLSSTMSRSSTSSTLSSVSDKARNHFNGLSSERRNNFKRSMDFLARKFSASTDLLEAFDDFDMEFSSNSTRRSSVNAMSQSVSEVFKCSPVFILGEEQQCSDSGSDTVSEISTDSSSDRSSIYSDDSLDFILYGKSNQGRSSFPFSASETQSWRQRNMSNNNDGSALRLGPRVWPRECNGVVSKALSRFTTVEQQFHSSVTSSSASVLTKSPIVTSSNSSSSNLNLVSSSTTRTSTTRSITGLEALRNRGENLVVIREPVRAGRYMRYSEVQCESVQARIRRFQVHGSS